MLSDTEIKRLRSLSDDALKAEIGRAVLKEKQVGLQARPPSLKKLVEEANAWLTAEHAKLQSAVCNDPEIRKIATSEPGSTEKLIRLVADAITAATIVVPVGSVAEYLVRDGIPKYCKAIWTPDT